MKRSIPIPSVFAVTAMLLLSPLSSQASLTTDGLVYNWDGDGQTTTSWTSDATEGVTNNTWSYSTDSLSTGLDSSTTITSAYEGLGATGAFTQGAGGSATNLSLSTYFSFEVWFKPDSLTGGAQMVFESGGNSKGISLTYTDATLKLWADNSNGSNNADLQLAASALSASDITDFIQVVGVIDNDTNNTFLYVNPLGTSNPENYNATIANASFWNGSNDAGLGGASGEAGGNPSDGPYGELAGQIGIFRMYNTALSGSDVANNFNAVAVPEPQTYALVLGCGLLAFGWLRRRR